MSEAPSPADDERTTGKGRPTPKRSEARKRRRVATPTNRKEAAALRRQKMREQRTTQRQALLSGDERYLPPRDAGPARRLARDVVDSRFTLGQIFFGLVLALLFLSLVPARAVVAVINLVMLLLFVGVVIDGALAARAAKRAVEEKFGAKQTAGVTSYALMRALQPRRLRRPPPKVKRGDPV